MSRNSTVAPRTESLLQRVSVPLAIAVLAFLVYYPTLNFGWTDTDDINLIREDAAFLTRTGSVFSAFARPLFPGGGERKSYYRPLVTASFLIDAKATTSLAPEQFHRMNAILHACAAALVFALATLFTKRKLFAAAAALCFAVHPAAVQSVAWVPGRSDGLMAVFALAAIASYVKYNTSGAARWFLVHIVTFAAALFAKESAVAIVPVAICYSLWVAPAPARLKAPRLLLGWLVTLIIWSIARRSVLGNVASGAQLASIVGNLPMLWVSIGKLLWPADLQVLATLRDSLMWPGTVAILLLALALLFAPAQPRRVLLWCSCAIPVCLLLPALLVDNQLVLDNRLYVPLAGLAVGAGVFADALVVTARARQGALVLTVVVCILLGRSTLSHSLAFETPRAFSEAAVRGSPHLPLAHLNLGSAEFRTGNLDAAETQFRAAINLDSHWPIAHNNLGLILMRRHQFAAAEAEFEAELANNPHYPKAHYNLGLLLTQTGRERAAIDHFEQVVALVPTDIDAWGELLKYFGPRDSTRAAQIMATMEALGVTFHAPSN